MAVNPEQALISAVIKKSDHVTAASRGINSTFFHSYPEEWKFIERYIASHKRTPSRNAFSSKFPDFVFKKYDDVEHFCEEVRTAHIRTELLANLQDVVGLVEDGKIDLAMKTNHTSILDLQSKMAGASSDSDIIANWQDTYAEVKRRVDRNRKQGQAGIPTGFATLDERTGGPQPGHVWIVAARLGQGKTWSLVRMAVTACFAGYKVQYDALEQTRAEIAMRVHTFASSKYGRDVFRNLDLAQGQGFSTRDYKEFLQGLSTKISGKFHVADTSGGKISPLTLAAQFERNQPDAMYLDYITLMEKEGDDHIGTQKLSAALKQIASRYQVPIIAAAQLNRNAVGSREPSGPENLAESDAIGRDADAVITMQQISRHVLMFKLAKFRHGRDGFTWYTKFLPNTGHFVEVTFDEAQDVIEDDRNREDDEKAGSGRNSKPKSFKDLGEGMTGKPQKKRRVVMKRP